MTEFGPALDSLLGKLDQWQDSGKYPFFSILDEAGATSARLADGRRVTVFASTDYLGLSHHPRVIDAAVDAVRRFGANSYGPQASGGYTAIHHELEGALASYLGKQDAMVFPTGMQANLGVLGTLAGPGHTILTDRLNHTSIPMGAQLSGADVQVFRHNDTDHLAALLAAAGSAKGRLVVVDGLFSADGDFAPLGEIARLAATHDAVLVVDEAHSVGTIGATGRGVAELAGVLDQVDVITGSLTKAFGSGGGFAAGRRSVIRVLRHAATSYLFSASLPPPTAGAALAALSVVADEGSVLRETLRRNAGFLRTELRAAGVDLAVSDSHVIPVIVGGGDETASAATSLIGRGLLTVPMFAPAVPIGSARLRLGVTSAHTAGELGLAAREIPAVLGEIAASVS